MTDRDRFIVCKVCEVIEKNYRRHEAMAERTLIPEVRTNAKQRMIEDEELLEMLKWFEVEE